jgi:hypothetical protein
VTTSPSAAWPEIPLEGWADTYVTLHMWTQVVGKVRLALTPNVNHWWHVPLYVTAQGLSTSTIPYEARVFEIVFDFVCHNLRIRDSAGSRRTIPLEPRSVADFYRELMDLLRSLGIEVSIWTTPVEVPDPIRFDEDHDHASYDPEYAQRWWQATIQADRVFRQFRSRFMGKVSPVHFFWGAFDLAVTRFSGRRAPAHPGGMPGVGDWVMREAYSHEVSSAGFWPGGGAVDQPMFYSYAYPEPDGFSEYPVQPKQASYHGELGEFLLPYETVRTAGAPDEVLMGFLQTTYEAAADLARWDREALERPPDAGAALRLPRAPPAG